MSTLFYFTRMDHAPKNVDSQGLTPEEQDDIKILCNNGERQQVVYTTIPYYDYNGDSKVIVGAIYSIVRNMLPPLLPSLLPPPGRPAYAIRDIPGRGKGIVATRNIALGEIVIVERPIIIRASFMSFIEHFQLESYAKESLHPQDWANFKDLLNVKDKNVSHFLGIIGTNSFHVDLKKWKEGYGGLFLELSRINHSCGPNLVRFWNPNLFTLSVQAVRPIQLGQELTLPYEPLCNTSHADRRFDLERKYKFKCNCGYCTNTSPTSDQDRLIRDESVLKIVLEQTYAPFVRPGLSRTVGRQLTRQFISNLVTNLELVVKEGIESISAFWHYVYLMKTWGLLGDKKEFKKWGFKAILLSLPYIEENGQDARLAVERWIDWVKHPEKTFPGWGRFKLRVELPVRD